MAHFEEILENKINQLTNVVPKNIGKFVNGNLEELYLSRIGINLIPITFFDDPFFSNLRKLHLNTNKLSSIPSNLFKPLKNLEYLSVRKNQIYTLNHDSFAGLHNLKTLNLSNNIITEIDKDTFKDLKKLESLNLKQNQITEIPENVFNSCPNLYYLNLSMNLLTEFPKALLRQQNLSNLLLSKNLIPYEFAKDFISSKTIKLISNEFTEYYNKKFSPLDLNKDIIRQFIFDQMLATYHFIVNTPIKQHSLKTLILSYMAKNFNLILDQNELLVQNLEFRQVISVWKTCLELFEPINMELNKFLNLKEDLNEKKRRALERNEARMKEIEASIIESGGILDIDEVLETKINPEPIDFQDLAFFNIIKKFWDWNNPELSTLFL